MLNNAETREEREARWDLESPEYSPTHLSPPPGATRRPLTVQIIWIATDLEQVIHLQRMAREAGGRDFRVHSHPDDSGLFDLSFLIPEDLAIARGWYEQE